MLLYQMTDVLIPPKYACSRVIRQFIGFVLLCVRIWLEGMHCPVNQWDATRKLNATSLIAFNFYTYFRKFACFHFELSLAPQPFNP